MSGLEVFGYISSVLVAVSLMMSNVFKLRVINFVGAGGFSIYGLLIGAYPVFILNGGIALVDLYFLYKMFTAKDYFSLIYLYGKKAAFLEQFLKFYNKDILTYFPEFNLEKYENPQIIYVMRNMITVGLFVYQAIDKDRIEILLDYTTPDYRDFKNSKFLYSRQIPKLIQEGYSIYCIETSNTIVQKYVKKIGFVESKDNTNMFEKCFFPKEDSFL
ncbi:hypothetical protein JXR93_12975 [bacterium]|nr:hypothetical protein [bacterium]